PIQAEMDRRPTRAQNRQEAEQYRREKEAEIRRGWENEQYWIAKITQEKNETRLRYLEQQLAITYRSYLNAYTKEDLQDAMRVINDYLVLHMEQAGAVGDIGISAPFAEIEVRL